MFMYPVKCKPLSFMPAIHIQSVQLTIFTKNIEEALDEIAPMRTFTVTTLQRQILSLPVHISK